MSDVQRGDIFRPTAEEWNGFRAAARHAAAAERSGGGADFRALPPGVVLVRNVEDHTLPDRAAVNLGSVVVNPDNAAAGEESYRSAPPCFNARTPDGFAVPWGVLLQPLAAGAIGRALVSGGVMARVYREDGATIAGPEPGRVHPVAGRGGAHLIWQDEGSDGDLVWAYIVVAGFGAVDPAVVPAVVVNENAGVYTVDLYGNGITQTRTGRAKLVVPEVNMLTALDTGTVVLAHLVDAALADHDEEEDDSGSGGDGSGGDS